MKKKTTQAARVPRWLRRLAPTHLSSRIILFNIIGLVSLMAGLSYFSQSREGLISTRVQSLMTQGHIISATLAASAISDTGEMIVDPETLHKQFEPVPEGERLQDEREGESDTFLINPAQVAPVLHRLLTSTHRFLSDLRAYVYDRDGVLLFDSYSFIPSVSTRSNDAQALPQRTLSDFFWRQVDTYFSRSYPPDKGYGQDNGKDFPEVTASLNGAAVSIIRMNAKKEIIVAVAIPIQRFGVIIGSLILSTKGGEIDRIIRKERNTALLIFLFTLLVTTVLAVALAGHIAEPIRLLSQAAERVQEGLDRRFQIPDFTDRRDEIGHLSKSLRAMTQSLYKRLDAIEAFAADVSHELKNPLTSLRSAIELLPSAQTDDQRARLLLIAHEDIGRLNRLITDISDASRLDAELARNKAEPIDLLILLKALCAQYMNNQELCKGKRILLEVIWPFPSLLDSEKNEHAFVIFAHAERIGQVFRNILDNALSFSPEKGQIVIHAKGEKETVEITIEDQGPGIDPEAFEKIFSRFYTDRPSGVFGQNSGLGLSISRQITQAYRGTLTASNRMGTDGDTPVVLGARFCLKWPRATRFSA